MKLKQITMTTGLLLVSYLANGAIYETQEGRASPDFSHIETLGEPYGSAFRDLDVPSQKNSAEQLKLDYYEALHLLDKRKLNAVEPKIKLLIERAPNEAQFYNLQATLEVYKKEYKLAIKSYQQALELNANNISSQLGIAIVFMELGDLAQVKKHANKALSIDDSSIHAYFLLADIASKERRPKDVEQLLLTAQKKVKRDKRLELRVVDKLTNFYFMQQQPDKALAMAMDAQRRYPNDSDALELLASVQVFNKQPMQAIITLNALIKQESTDFRNRLLLAKLLVMHPGKEQQILKLLKEVALIAPNNARAHLQRGVVLTQLKHFSEALQAAQKVKRLVPDSGLGEVLEAEVFLAEKKLDAALGAFKKSYKIKPVERVLKAISDIFIAQEKESEAIDFIGQELKRNPNNLMAHFLLGDIYRHNKNFARAEVHYLAILKEQPDNLSVLNNLAWVYYLESNPKALVLAEKAHLKAPTSADIADTYASILIQQGDLAKGLVIFEQAGALAPNNYDIQYHLANAYVLNHQPEAAIKILKSITKTEQSFSEKHSAVRLLRELE
jgi:putative PEP-CTERM system TPR-repeat lipoprotein